MTPAVAQQAGTDKAAIRPFNVNVPQAELTELRRRINATKWPERETVTAAPQGVQLATIQALARYWATDYDWHTVDVKLKALPQFMTEIDGLDIHFIHVHSEHNDAPPLIVTHRMARLDHRADEDYRPTDQSHGTWRDRIGRSADCGRCDRRATAYSEARLSCCGSIRMSIAMVIRKLLMGKRLIENLGLHHHQQK